MRLVGATTELLSGKAPSFIDKKYTPTPEQRALRRRQRHERIQQAIKPLLARTKPVDTDEQGEYDV
jgi:hypothetical protein